MRIATFNTNNLFQRASVMSLGDWSSGRAVLEDVEKLTDLLARSKYTVRVKAGIETILDRYGFGDRNRKDRPYEIVEAREKLFTVQAGTKKAKVRAGGRGEWVGWIELAREMRSSQGVDNTACVVAAVDADVLCAVEVEDRIALDRFNAEVIARFTKHYAVNMLVDGNDPRGIDVGLLSRHPIESVRSHIDAVYTTPTGAKERVFSRDCPEFEVKIGTGDSLWILGNHFKSQGYGAKSKNDAKRTRQAAEVARIYVAARKRSALIVVAGDFNDVPASQTLKPLLAKTDLRDAMSHPSYKGPTGTYMTSAKKFDYLLFSPALWKKVVQVGVERGGIFAPHAGDMFPSVTSLTNQASDHAAVWADLSL